MVVTVLFWVPRLRPGKPFAALILIHFLVNMTRLRDASLNLILQQHGVKNLQGCSLLDSCHVSSFFFLGLNLPTTGSDPVEVGPRVKGRQGSPVLRGFFISPPPPYQLVPGHTKAVLRQLVIPSCHSQLGVQAGWLSIPFCQGEVRLRQLGAQCHYRESK